MLNPKVFTTGYQDECIKHNAVVQILLLGVFPNALFTEKTKKRKEKIRMKMIFFSFQSIIFILTFVFEDYGLEVLSSLHAVLLSPFCLALLASEPVCWSISHFGFPRIYTF